MSEQSLFPTTYAEWRQCIEVRCGVPLTQRFIQTRIDELTDDSNSHTSSFIKRYGVSYHSQILEWFRLAEADKSGGHIQEQ